MLGQRATGRETMESPLTGNLSSAREKVIEELVKGRGYAAQLQIVLRDLTESGHGTASTEDLVTKMLMSFKKALSILGSSKNPASSPGLDQHRKQSKNRDIQETWTRITATPIEDGYCWRKYGQKEILNAKYLRCYFRCAYKFNNGCLATKQVQRTEDEPPTFWTKYIGHHTCQAILEASFFMDSTAKEGRFLNFESNTPTKQEPPFFSSFPFDKDGHNKSFPSIKQDPNPSSLKYLPPQDLTKFKSSIPTSMFPSTSQSGHGNVVSGCTTSSSRIFEVDMVLMDSICLSDEELFQPSFGF